MANWATRPVWRGPHLVGRTSAPAGKTRPRTGGNVLMENFWSIIWVVVWSFLFVAYLFVLFYILTDLFRDSELSGWWKALWIIFLIFMP